MILPNNGKVIIIDDRPDEVENLMIALTKEKMPFLFYSKVDGEDLPEEGNPVENVRLVFLDLDLGVDGSDTGKIRTIQGRIEKIIAPNTPYILVIWSKNEDRYKKLLMEEFEDGFKQYKPIASCSLDKTTISKMGDEAKVIIEHIRNELKNQLSKFNSFNAFLLWESIVNKSCGEISNGFTKIFDFDGNWDKNINAFFYRLAKANVGEQKIDNIGDHQKLQLALETINSALIDSIEKNIKLSDNPLDIKINGKDVPVSAERLALINTKLHLLYSTNLSHFQPGNLYFKDYTDEELITEIIKKTFDKSVIDEIIKSKPQMIHVDVTPACDYSQDKGYTRVLGGIIIDGKYHDKKYQKSQSPIFIYDLCPVLNIQDKYSYLIFDYRYFASFKKEVFEKHFKKPTYKIRNQLLTDLQAGLSNHINRPGIVSVE